MFINYGNYLLFYQTLNKSPQLKDTVLLYFFVFFFHILVYGFQYIFFYAFVQREKSLCQFCDIIFLFFQLYCPLINRTVFYVGVWILFIDYFVTDWKLFFTFRQVTLIAFGLNSDGSCLAHRTHVGIIFCNLKRLCLLALNHQTATTIY